MLFRHEWMKPEGGFHPLEALEMLIRENVVTWKIGHCNGEDVSPLCCLGDVEWSIVKVNMAVCINKFCFT